MIIPGISDWITFLGIGIILIGGYILIKRIDPNIANSIKNFFKRFGFLIIVVLLWLYFRSSWGYLQQGELLANKADSYFLFILLFYYLSVLFIKGERYKTTQFVGHGVHGSFIVGDFPLLTHDGFYIFPLDQICSELLPKIKSCGKIAVVREELVKFFPDGAASVGQFKKIDKIRLPPSVIQVLNKYHFMKGVEEIYYAWYTSDYEIDWTDDTLKEAAEIVKNKFKLTNPNINTLLELLAVTNASYNNLDEHFTGTVRNNEAKAGHDKRILDMKYGKQQKDYGNQNYSGGEQ